MKRNIPTLLVGCICMIVASCSNEATILGTADNAKIILYSFIDGEISMVQCAEVDKESSSFELSVQLPYEGIYLIGRYAEALFPVYLKGGEKVSADYKDNRLYLTGHLSKENSLLYKWENQSNEVKINSFLYNYLPGENSCGYEEFFKSLDEVAAHRDDMLKELDGKKGDFYEWMRTKLCADLDFYALSYLRAFGMNIPENESLPSYYDNMDPDAIFQNQKILTLPYAGKMLETYVWYLEKEDVQSLSYPFTIFKDRTLQQEYLVSSASQFRYYDEYENLLSECGADFFTGPYKKRMEKIEAGLSWSKSGTKAYDFKAMAPDSTWVRLSDYKGKTVVVDVWATWCDPCRRMMPLFHDMQKDFKGENIVFMSICVGVWVEVDKWEELSREYQLKENNFFIEGWNSEFAKNYHISGVPRYMIFDKEGRIVTVDAPNPTTDKLKQLILKTLQCED